MIVIEIEKWEQARCRDLRVQNLRTHFEAYSAAIALVEGSTGAARTINPYDILIQTTSLNYRNNRNAFSINTRRSGPMLNAFISDDQSQSSECWFFTSFPFWIKIDLSHFVDNNLLNSEKIGYCTLMSGSIFFFFAKFGFE